MLINGQPATTIAVSDRGLAYGDGLFETVRFHQRRLVLWPGHLNRLLRGCETLQLTLDTAVLERELAEALALAHPDNGVLKLIVTRGTAGRGYRASRTTATRIITVHPLPDYSGVPVNTGVRAFLCSQRLAAPAALAGLKHLNRLEQVLASLEWPDESFHEGLMLDVADNVIEGTRSNVFMAASGRLYTPALDKCGIDGVLAAALDTHFGPVVTRTRISLEQLSQADEVFFCNSVFGIWPLGTLVTANEVHSFLPGPFAQEARALFERMLDA